MSLYNTLGVSKDATKEEMKRAYKRGATGAHPDKKGGNTKKFQELKRAFDVLNDDEKRKRYDETGEVDTRLHPARDELALSMIMDLFMKITAANQFRKKNYFPEIIAKLTQAEAANQNTSDTLQKTVNKMSYLAEHTKGSTQIRERIMAQVDMAKREQEKCDKHIQVVGVAIDIARKCEYDGEDFIDMGVTQTTTIHMGGMNWYTTA